MRHGKHVDPLRMLNIPRHRDDLLAIARAFSGHDDATSARGERVDSDGIDLVVETPRGPATSRVEFADRVVDYPGGLRDAFAELAHRARAALA